MGKLLISVSQAAVVQGELAIEACIRCSPSEAAIPFWRVLHSFRRYAVDQVEYILPVLARCPRCRGQIDETMLVKPKVHRLSKQRDPS
jgi:hypothetical protein